MHMFLNASEVTQANTHRADSTSRITAHSTHILVRIVTGAIHVGLFILAIAALVDLDKNEVRGACEPRPFAYVALILNFIMYSAALLIVFDLLLNWQHSIRGMDSNKIKKTQDTMLILTAIFTALAGVSAWYGYAIPSDCKAMLEKHRSILTLEVVAYLCTAVSALWAIACAMRNLHSPYVVHGLLFVLFVVSIADTFKNETSDCDDVTSTIIVLLFSQIAYFITVPIFLGRVSEWIEHPDFLKSSMNREDVLSFTTCPSIALIPLTVLAAWYGHQTASKCDSYTLLTVVAYIHTTVSGVWLVACVALLVHAYRTIPIWM
jgi:hypothetical protein